VPEESISGSVKALIGNAPLIRIAHLAGELFAE